MAIEKTLTFRGVAVPNAYIRITKLEGDKTQLNATLCYYVSRDADEPFDGCIFGFDYNLMGANPYEQAYAYAKTLPTFSDATDVLEAGQTA